MNTFEIQSHDGLTLRGRAWNAEAPRAVVAFIHGLGEHCGRYDHVGQAFAARGVSLVATDLRGHGLSDGRRGHAPDYDALMDDVDLLLKAAAKRHPNTPLFFYGHSLGGNIAMSHAMKRAPDIAGVIVSAPLLRLAFEPPKWKTSGMRILNRWGLVVTLPSGLDDKKISRDADALRAKRNDPLTHKRISSRLAQDMLEHGHWLLDHAAEFPYPILLTHGDDDGITSHTATQEFAAALTIDHQLSIWPGQKHEPFEDPDRANVIQLMLDWIERRLPA